MSICKKKGILSYKTDPYQRSHHSNLYPYTVRWNHFRITIPYAVWQLEILKTQIKLGLWILLKGLIIYQNYSKVFNDPGFPKLFPSLVEFPYLPKLLEIDLKPLKNYIILDHFISKSFNRDLDRSEFRWNVTKIITAGFFNIIKSCGYIIDYR